MKVDQRPIHLFARATLPLPVVGVLVRWWLVRLHVRVFVRRSESVDAEARREHLRAFFDASMDAYLTAIREGYPEVEARELTSTMAALDFHAHGWAELLMIPPEEIPKHVERHRDFFDRHDIDESRPLGVFTPPGGLPDAPETPERLEDGEFPRAEGGWADDVYVDAPLVGRRR